MSTAVKHNQMTGCFSFKQEDCGQIYIVMLDG